MSFIFGAHSPTFISMTAIFVLNFFYSVHADYFGNVEIDNYM